MKIIIGIILITLAAFASISHKDLDMELRRVLAEAGVTVLDPGPPQHPAKVELGRMLYFDKILSGNKDISCASCHHPLLHTGDSLALSVGVGGKGFGKARKMGPGRERIPRNAPEVFNRGSDLWHTMFWDSRVSGNQVKGFDSPAEEDLPSGLDNILAVQAMFPVTSPDEMRGEIIDKDVYGEENELGPISGAMPNSIWYRLMRRLLVIPEYGHMFEAAYPGIPIQELGFQHAANAIAAFEIDAFTLLESPWDRYLNGNNEALTNFAKEGALLFYGKGNCGNCHSGPLMTDQKHHNIGIPQFGPGKGNAHPLDPGRYLETGNPDDRFAFRTPPLRNVALTGPWMHNGAYSNLRDVIRHHLDPAKALKQFDGSGLEPDLQPTLKRDARLHERILEGLDPLVTEPLNFSEEEIDKLMAFLHTLTDSNALNLSKTVPKSVPSELPVED